MANLLPILLWAAATMVGIALMQWGAGRMAGLIDGLRGRFGWSATATGAIMGLATASPEISVNVASVAFGWPDLGLGAALGSNVPALPLAFILAYLSTRFAAGRGRSEETTAPPRVQPEAVPVQIVPYLLVVLLLALLTLPPPLAGLQPVDGAILLAAFGLYFARAVWGQARNPGAALPAGTIPRTLVGVPAIAAGALLSVVAARRLGGQLGLSDLVTGLFIIGLLCAMPEALAAWRFAREGKTTTAVAGAASDGIVSLTVALLPPAIIGAAVGNTAIYLINLVFLAGTLVAYWGFNRPGRGEALGAPRVALFGAGYGIYLAATVLILTR